MKQQVKIGDVKPNPNNPRFIKDSDFKKLVSSIKGFPKMLKVRPIVVDENMMVLGGNMRLEACKAAGLKEVWIDDAEDWTEEEKREFIIKDNSNYGQWDFDILGNEWSNEQLVEWGVDVPDYFSDSDDDDFGNFDDDGIANKNQYGVIVMCDSEGTQESVFNDLTKMGFNCKIVVT